MNDELGGLVKEMFFWRLPLTPSKLILLVCEINSNPWDSFKALSSLRFSFYNHFSVRMRLLLDGWNRTFPANVNYYSHCVCILWLLPFSLSVFVLFFFVLILYFFFFLWLPSLVSINVHSSALVFNDSRRVPRSYCKSIFKLAGLIKIRRLARMQKPENGGSGRSHKFWPSTRSCQPSLPALWSTLYEGERYAEKIGHLFH